MTTDINILIIRQKRKSLEQFFYARLIELSEWFRLDEGNLKRIYNYIYTIILALKKETDGLSIAIIRVLSK